jgi:erythromycin esterase-like protein
MTTVNAIEKQYQSIRTSKDLNKLIDRIGDSRYVLLGEASHGTHEYYIWRTAISRRLIEEKGFSFVAVEGDWPDCYRINRFAKGYDQAEAKAVDVLHAFSRWPTWMWANWETAALLEWLRDHNRNLPADRRVGFYGLDVYSLWESMEAMIRYLRREDPAAAQFAIQALRCFEPYEEGQEYARAMLHLSASCQDEVVRLLKQVRRKSRNYDHDPEAALNTEMNAQVIANAERYFRSMVSFTDESWNIRDSHMVDTLNALTKFHGKKAKAIVWEHNTHVGDARYTDMRDNGLFNVGQLVREQHQKDGVFVAGFSSYQGTVIAGRNWGGKMQEMTVPAAVEGSVEEILHTESRDDRMIIFGDHAYDQRLDSYRGHRAIGVVYHPENEYGNYASTLLPSRYDALLYFDRTTALHPLHLHPSGAEVPDTYPFGV